MISKRYSSGAFHCLQCMTVIVLLSVAMMTGCASITAKEQLDDLQETLRNYETAFRWAQYQSVKGYIKDFSGQTLRFERLHAVKITSYEVLSLKVSEKDLKAEQEVEISYYYPEYMIEKTLIDRQLWVFDGTVKRWLLDSDLPNFK